MTPAASPEAEHRALAMERAAAALEHHAAQCEAEARQLHHSPGLILWLLEEAQLSRYRARELVDLAEQIRRREKVA